VVSATARRRRSERAIAVATSLLTALDTAIVVYVLAVTPPILGAGDYLLFGVPIANAAMRQRLRGALAVWVVTSVVAVLGVVAGRGGASPPLEQINFILVANLTLAAVVGRMAEDLHEQFDELEFQARTDMLTGLANRRAFIDTLERLPAGPRRRVALLFIDLDGFKTVNDTLGHHAGDELLGIVALRLQHQIRAGDAGARLAGDEFVVLLYDRRRAEAEAVAQRIRGAIETPIEIRGVPVVVEASIGLATAWTDELDPDTLIAQADVAMYADKAGRRRVDAPRGVA
jgi:diguanylate cyclase (GGDEF)-like protein